MTPALWRLPRATSFWLLAVLFALLLFSASAPTPLYAVYAARWHFSAITLITIYAAYAAGGLTGLLTTGRLADHLGRRPVVMLALSIQIVAMFAFISAHGVGALYLGRVLQGLAIGIGSGAISAWLLDVQPADNARLGSIAGGVALLAGLGGGALGSGLLVQYGPDPMHLVFWLLAAVYAISLATVLLIPDLVEHAPGWLRSMIPEIGVPQVARSLFARLVPSLIAIWALGGLYLSLGPSLATLLLRSDSRIAGGLVVVSLAGAGAVASAVFHSTEPRSLVVRGSLVLIAGVGITLLAVATSSAAGLYAGSVIAGLGFGPAFLGIFRSLAPLAPRQERSALLAAIYFVVYVSFSVPAIMAGAMATRYGLRDATYFYGLAVIAMAGLTTIAMSRGSAAAGAIEPMIRLGR